MIYDIDFDSQNYLYDFRLINTRYNNNLSPLF